MIFKTAREYVITFGKYKGETLEEIYVEDQEYLAWLADTTDNPVLRKQVKECFKEMKAVRVFE